MLNKENRSVGHSNQRMVSGLLNTVWKFFLPAVEI